MGAFTALATLRATRKISDVHINSERGKYIFPYKCVGIYSTQPTSINHIKHLTTIAIKKMPTQSFNGLSSICSEAKKGASKTQRPRGVMKIFLGMHYYKNILDGCDV